MSAKTVALGISAEEMIELLDYLCPDKTKMSIQHLTTLQWTGLKFLFNVNALLQGSSEHYDMQLETMGEIIFDEGHQSKYIIFDPSKLVQKTDGGGHKQGDLLGLKLC